MSIFRRLKIDASLVSIFKHLKIDEETLHNFRVSGDATKLESPLPSPDHSSSFLTKVIVLEIKRIWIYVGNLQVDVITPIEKAMKKIDKWKFYKIIIRASKVWKQSPAEESEPCRNHGDQKDSNNHWISQKCISLLLLICDHLVKIHKVAVINLPQITHVFTFF